MAQPPPQYTYTPPPAELPYYNALFAAADKQSAGYLSGPSAVEFLSLSKLPIDLLKQIWTMADNPTSNTLDANKFYVAVRLIQLFQNGKKPVDLALNLAEGDAEGVRMPFFEGVNVQQAMMQQAQQQQQPPPPPQQQQQQPPPPPQQQQQQPPVQQQQMGQQQPSPQMQPQQSPQMGAQPSPQMGGLAQPTMNGGARQQPPSTTLAVQDPYTMTPQELSRYEALFPTYAQPDPADGKMYVGGAAAVELFSKSGMDRDALKTVWTMVDDPIDNKLDSIEFAIAMHLIVCITKKGLPMPPAGLPGSLKAAVSQARGGQPSPQIQPQGAPQQGMGGQSVAGGVPPSPGGIPSPDKRPSMGGGMMQQPQMNGGAMPPPQQMGQMGAPQMGMQQQQPQMGGQPGMQQMQQGMQQMGIQQTGSFGGGTVGGQTVDDAFAGLSNDPVASVDEYSTVGGVEVDGGVSGGMSTMGGMTGLGGLSQQPTVQEVATPEPSPQPVAPTIQHAAAIPAPPLQQQQQQPPQQYQQQNALPPRSPRGPPKTSERIASPRSAAAKSLPASEESTAELAQLRQAHQKLQAEVISLRAKAASVSEEEQETQKEIAQVAGEIGKLSMELSELKDDVMEAKVKLTESVGILKVQMEKKESLEAQVAELRGTHEALTSATEAVIEANDLAMAQQARAVAAAAAAKEEAESVIPPPAAPEVPQPVVETADLFSWDAPAPTPIPPAQESVNPVSTWGSDTPSVQLSSNPTMMGAAGQEMTPTREPVSSQPAPAQWGSGDMADTHSVQSNQVAPTPSVAAAPAPEENPNFGMYSAGTSNPNPYAGFQGMGMGGAMGAPPASMGGGGGDLFGVAMGGAPPPQPAMTPMGGAPPPAATFDSHSVAPSVVPQTPERTSFDDQAAAVAAAPAPQPPAPKSPSKADMEALKSETAKAEKEFQSSLSLVRSISVEVNQLESAAKKAESEAKAMEGKKKKGSFVGGKKKAKKELERAIEVAQQERNKVKEAKAQLAAAERESENARREMEEYRQKYEQLELEAATAASYMSVQQQHGGGHQRSDSQSVSGQSAAGGAPAQYTDPFGGGMMNHAPTPAASNQYGMGLMGGGDYANPFL